MMILLMIVVYLPLLITLGCLWFCQFHREELYPKKTECAPSSDTMSSKCNTQFSHLFEQM